MVFKLMGVVAKAVRMIIPLIVLTIILGVIVYTIYNYTGSVIQNMEHKKHVREEEALESIEVMKGSIINLNNMSEVQEYNFQLKEGDSYVINNLLIEYSFYDPDTNSVVVTLYCNDYPYDVVKFQPLGSSDSYTVPLFSCKGWGEEYLYSIVITPEKFIKVYHDLSGSGLKQIVVEHYILDFQVKVKIKKTS